jgi:hypothetical protein
MHNPPAFPLHNHGTQTLGMHFTGMTLRDYFAAKAMQAMFINQNVHSATMLLAKQTDTPEENVLAKLSYEVADAMMEERSE